MIKLPPELLTALGLDPEGEHNEEELNAAIQAKVDRVNELEAVPEEPEPEVEPEVAPEEPEEDDEDEDAASAANDSFKNYVDQFVGHLADQAIADGKILEADRAQLISAINERDVQGAIDYVKALPQAINTSTELIDGIAAQKAQSNLRATSTNAIVDAVDKIKKRDGCDHGTAYNTARKEQPSLFATDAE